MKKIYDALDEYKWLVILINSLAVLGSSTINPLLAKVQGVVLGLALISVFSVASKVGSMLAIFFKDIPLKITYRIHIVAEVLTGVGVVIFLYSQFTSIVMIFSINILMGLIGNNITFSLDKYNNDQYGTTDWKDYKHLKKLIVSFVGIVGNIGMIFIVRKFGNVPIICIVAATKSAVLLMQIKMYKDYVQYMQD